MENVGGVLIVKVARYGKMSYSVFIPQDVYFYFETSQLHVFGATSIGLIQNYKR